MDQHITVHIQKGEGFIPDSTVHEEMKCPFCPKKYAKLSSVNKNISLAHANCLYCPEKFESQKDMCAHAMKCQFSPAKGANMDAHVISVHYIKCQFCPAKCFSEKDMDQHITQAHVTTSNHP